METPLPPHLTSLHSQPALWFSFSLSSLWFHNRKCTLHKNRAGFDIAVALIYGLQNPLVLTPHPLPLIAFYSRVLLKFLSFLFLPFTYFQTNLHTKHYHQFMAKTPFAGTNSFKTGFTTKT